jgi:hypothetical protein
MVQEFDAHDLAGLGDAFGEADILVRGAGVAGRMVMLCGAFDYVK